MVTPKRNPSPIVSVVVPVFNESDNLQPLVDRTQPILDALRQPYELIFVDDGSTDDTAARVERLTAADNRIRLVRLSRNFGHQAALVAGLEYARGNAVVTMDGDLQHPPELIPRLVDRWREGHDIVQTIRRQSADTSLIKRAGSRSFYRLLSSVTRLNVTPGAADFRLMSREAVVAFLSCGERRRCNRALVQWIGFSYTELPYDAEPRHTGRSKYSYRAMFRLASDAIFSFSTWPLRLAGLTGAIVSAAAGGYLLYVLWAYTFTDRAEPGWSSILATVLILGGVTLVVLWILGEYVGRLYEEVKHRPIYIVRSSPVSHTPEGERRTAVDDDASPNAADAPGGSSIHAKQG